MSDTINVTLRDGVRSTHVERVDAPHGKIAYRVSAGVAQ